MENNSYLTSNKTNLIKLIYWALASLLFVAGVIFFYWQNSDSGIGGKIALPKLIWLADALWFWYFLPILIGIDSRISPNLRWAYWIFFGNMVLRAIAELWMMYVSHNWHPYWGISHDVFSVILILGLLFRTQSKTELDNNIDFNFKITGLMFLIESYFAWYMLKNVKVESGPVYFVPGNGQHLAIMIVTWIVVIALTIQQFFFYKKWFNKVRSDRFSD